MYALLISAFNWLILNVLRVNVLKFALLTLFALGVAALADIIFSQLADIDLLAFDNMARGLPDGILYFMEVFQIHVGIPLLLGAHVARFTIRRLPFIG